MFYELLCQSVSFYLPFVLTARIIWCISDIFRFNCFRARYYFKSHFLFVDVRCSRYWQSKDSILIVLILKGVCITRWVNGLSSHLAEIGYWQHKSYWVHDFSNPLGEIGCWQLVINFSKPLAEIGCW